MAHVKHTSHSPTEQLIQHLDPDERHKPCDSDKFINTISRSIHSVHLQPPIAVYFGRRNGEGFRFCFHCCCGVFGSDAKPPPVKLQLSVGAM